MLTACVMPQAFWAVIWTMLREAFVLRCSREVLRGCQWRGKPRFKLFLLTHVMHFSLDDSTFSSVREPQAVTAKRQMDSGNSEKRRARSYTSVERSAVRRTHARPAPEFLEDVARDDASARATEAAGGAGEAPRGFLARAWSLGKSGSRRGREPKKAPGDDNLSARFLAEASAVTVAIEAWRRDLADLRRAHAAAADAASTRALAETRRALLENDSGQRDRRVSRVHGRGARARGETFSSSFSDVPFPSDAFPKPKPKRRAANDLRSILETKGFRHERRDDDAASRATRAHGRRGRAREVRRRSARVRRHQDARCRRREEALSTRHFLRHATVPNLDAARRAAEAEAEDILDASRTSTSRSEPRSEPRVLGNSGRTAGTADPKSDRFFRFRRRSIRIAPNAKRRRRTLERSANAP